MTEQPPPSEPPRERHVPDQPVLPNWVPTVIGIVLVLMAGLAVYTGLRYRNPTLANGIIKTIADDLDKNDRYKLPLRLNDLVAAALKGYEGSEAAKNFKSASDAPAQILEFFRERVQFYLKDHRGFTYDTVNAVLATGYEDVVDAVRRCEAVGQIRSSADFEPLFVAFKRIKNIIRQAREKKSQEDAEAELTKAMKQGEDLLNRIKDGKPE